MKVMIERTVSQIEPIDDWHFGKDLLTLRDFESARCYVLLGEPGMGKSTEFNKEARRVHADPPIPARQFLSRNMKSHFGLRESPLFIHGLDEVRIDGGDIKNVLDKIITQLEDWGNPKLRLSCRSVNWLGNTGREELNTILGSLKIPILQLNPLNHDDVREIVTHSGNDSNSIIHRAQEHGLGPFLYNPQLLELLLNSVEADGWPDSPTEIFERACSEIVKGQYRERHDIPSSKRLSTIEEVLSAAGQLFAIMLIADKAGWSAADTKDSEVFSLHEVETPNYLTFREALGSGLFEGSCTSRGPLHRLLAEFLGARYLAGEIKAGLSLRRVCALLMRHDGIPLPDLRGLAGWLATFNIQAREILVKADPITTAYNGDASNFSYGERQELLNNLEYSLDFTCAWPFTSPLGILASNRGMSLIWELSGSSLRSENRQMLVHQLLRSFSRMCSGMGIDRKILPPVQLEISRQNLLRIVYDPSWQEEIRCEALRVLNLTLIDKSNRETTFAELLNDLQRGFLLDEGNDLRGTVLDILYPCKLQPSEVWDYLVNRTVAYRYNAYLAFWHHLIDRSQEKQIKELLESLCARASEVIPKLTNHRLSNIVPQLLERGLEMFGDELSIPDLYRWFKLVEYDVQTSQLVSVQCLDQSYSRNNVEASTAILNWLGHRKIVQRGLIEYELITRELEIVGDDTLSLKFVGKYAPTGFRSWCLARAGELWDSYPKAAERLACWSVSAQKGWEKPLSDDKVEMFVLSTPILHEWNQRRLRNKEQLKSKKAKSTKKQVDRKTAFQKRKKKELASIRRQKNELTEGTGPPLLLHRLAAIYFDGLSTEEGEPKDKLGAYLDGDKELVQAALEGFCNLLDQEDLPDLDRIAQLYETGQISYYANPFLAGMEEQDEKILDRMDEKGKRRALGFYFVADVSPHYFDPKWYEQALKRYPEAVADALVSIHNACVRARYLPDKHLFNMAFDERYTQIASIAVRRMLSVFPTRCSRQQLKSLRVVLWSAILARGMSTEELRNLVIRRLNRKNMDIAQRSQWLGAGICVARDHCIPLLEEFLSTGQESRVRRILDFLVMDDGKCILQNLDDWSSEETLKFVQVLGACVQRLGLEDNSYFLVKKEVNEEKFDTLLIRCLKALVNSTSDEATNALVLLFTDPKLVMWKEEIVRAQEKQHWKHQAKRQQEPNAEQIQKVFQNGPPASAADLAALTTDVLEELADHIRYGETNDWRQYWNWDQSTKKPAHPKDENDCRDLLLSDLIGILRQYDIHAQPEGWHADERRADIRISYGSNFSVPIEIKKNSHRKIWHGISEQLGPKCMRDPNSDGHGIHLVIWFGADRKHMRMLSPSGGVPKRPEQLKSMLIEQLDPKLSNRINVVVIDVSLSSGYATSSEMNNAGDKTLYSYSASPSPYSSISADTIS
ncbi:MAG: hypothetical protein F4221_05340 [Rhodothermaceae bacterium]|nr:hypothetical protein [Rhodothermaceae bacterium]